MSDCTSPWSRFAKNMAGEVTRSRGKLNGGDTLKGVEHVALVEALGFEELAPRSPDARARGRIERGPWIVTLDLFDGMARFAALFSNRRRCSFRLASDEQLTLLSRLLSRRVLTRHRLNGPGSVALRLERMSKSFAPLHEPLVLEVGLATPDPTGEKMPAELGVLQLDVYSRTPHDLFSATERLRPALGLVVALLEEFSSPRLDAEPLEVLSRQLRGRVHRDTLLWDGDRVRVLAIRAFMRRSNPAAFHLLQHLFDPGDAVAAEVLRALHALGWHETRARAIEMLGRCAISHEDVLTRAVRDVLRSRGEVEIVDAFLGAFGRAEVDPLMTDARYRAHVAIALSRILDSGSIAAIERAAKLAMQMDAVETLQTLRTVRRRVPRLEVVKKLDEVIAHLERVASVKDTLPRAAKKAPGEKDLPRAADDEESPEDLPRPVQK